MPLFTRNSSGQQIPYGNLHEGEQYTPSGGNATASLEREKQEPSFDTAPYGTDSDSQTPTSYYTQQQPESISDKNDGYQHPLQTNRGRPEAAPSISRESLSADERSVAPSDSLSNIGRQIRDLAKKLTQPNHPQKTYSALQEQAKCLRKDPYTHIREWLTRVDSCLPDQKVTSNGNVSEDGNRAPSNHDRATQTTPDATTARQQHGHTVDHPEGSLDTHHPLHQTTQVPVKKDTRKKQKKSDGEIKRCKHSSKEKRQDQHIHKTREPFIEEVSGEPPTLDHNSLHTQAPYPAQPPLKRHLHQNSASFFAPVNPTTSLGPFDWEEDQVIHTYLDQKKRLEWVWEKGRFERSISNPTSDFPTPHGQDPNHPVPGQYLWRVNQVSVRWSNHYNSWFEIQRDPRTAQITSCKPYNPSFEPLSILTIYNELTKDNELTKGHVRWEMKNGNKWKCTNSQDESDLLQDPNRCDEEIEAYAQERVPYQWNALSQRWVELVPGQNIPYSTYHPHPLSS